MSYGTPYKGTVSYISGTHYEVLISGYGDINARNVTGLKIDVGNTVTVVQLSAGQWEIKERITVHPEPVIPEPTPATPLPSADTAAATPSGTGRSFVRPASDSNSNIVSAINTNNARYEDTLSRLTAIETALAALRTTLNTHANRLNAAAGRATDAAEASNAAGDAAVQSGAAKRIQDVSLPAAPPYNVAGYPDWSYDAQVAVTKHLAYRVQWTGEVRAALARGAAYAGTTAPPSLPAAPTTDVIERSWSDSVGIIQAIDDWAQARWNSWSTAINALRANQGLGAASYPGGVLAWSNRGSFTASKDGLATSIENHRARLAATGGAVVEPIRKINSA